MVGVLGPNGAGKSTLLKTILGLLPCRQGGIAFRGRKISHEPAHARFAAGISLCPEGRRVFKNLSVRENLLAGAFGQDKTVVGGTDRGGATRSSPGSRAQGPAGRVAVRR